jgi:hypothetical protein
VLRSAASGCCMMTPCSGSAVALNIEGSIWFGRTISKDGPVGCYVGLSSWTEVGCFWILESGAVCSV